MRVRVADYLENLRRENEERAKKGRPQVQDSIQGAMVFAKRQLAIESGFYSQNELDAASERVKVRDALRDAYTDVVVTEKYKHIFDDYEKVFDKRKTAAPEHEAQLKGASKNRHGRLGSAFSAGSPVPRGVSSPEPLKCAAFPRSRAPRSDEKCKPDPTMPILRGPLNTELEEAGRAVLTARDEDDDDASLVAKFRALSAWMEAEMELCEALKSPKTLVKEAQADAQKAKQSTVHLRRCLGRRFDAKRERTAEMKRAEKAILDAVVPGIKAEIVGMKKSLLIGNPSGVKAQTAGLAKSISDALAQQVRPHFSAMKTSLDEVRAKIPVEAPAPRAGSRVSPGPSETEKRKFRKEGWKNAGLWVGIPSAVVVLSTFGGGDRYANQGEAPKRRLASAKCRAESRLRPESVRLTVRIRFFAGC